MKIITYISVLLTLLTNIASCQNKQNLTTGQNENTGFSYKSLIIPAVLIVYGAVGINVDELRLVDAEINEEINEHIDKKFTIDDVSQYAPFVSVYALDVFGVKAKHNFKDRTIILGTAFLIMGSTTLTLKNLIHEKRPDGTSFDSFPSGHTATAFMGAEFLMHEYEDVSVWYGIAGYTVAAGTGFFRMYNKRHWLTDVAAGAGIGILSTRIAYWLYPVIKENIFGTNNDINGVVMPFYNGNEYGINAALTF